MCASVCVCVISSPCTSREMILHTNIVLLSRVNIYSSSSSAKSLCHSALASFPPFPSLPLALRCLSLLLYVSATERDPGQLQLGASVRVLPVEAIHYLQLVPIRPQPPYVSLPCHLSIPRATTCSNSFLTQLLHPVTMWLNLDLMVCRAPSISKRYSLVLQAYQRMFDTPLMPLQRGFFRVACLARQHVDLVARSDIVGCFVDFLLGNQNLVLLLLVKCPSHLYRVVYHFQSMHML